MLRLFMDWIRGRPAPTTAVEDFRHALLEPSEDRMFEAVRKRVNEIKKLSEHLDAEPQTEPDTGAILRRPE